MPQAALARRALVADPSTARRSWLRSGAVAVGVSVLGIGLAGSVATTGNAEHVASPAVVTAPRPAPAVTRPSVSVVPGVAAPTAFDRRDAGVSRGVRRLALDEAALEQSAGHQANASALASGLARVRAESKAVEARRASLEKAAEATKKKGKQIAAHRAEVKKRAEAKKEAQKQARKQAKKRAEARARAARHRAARGSLPVTSGFHIAARFGDTGSWSRYHTGIDFAAPMGTPVHAAAAGVVTHAGSGSAGWAGHYVTIRHSDGKSTLYAHMSTVAVSEGEHVSAGDRVGAIGMTGRTFGPHVHFEVYPAGVTPGDVYRAVNPVGWLAAHGLRP
jgi:murein DD-endopeptidase MepM/ murein hydrolase activator NlpD